MINIIMCTYNGEQYISEQLESIFQNTFQEWKLFIYDDQSTDRTKQIVDEFSKAHNDKIVFTVNKNKKGAIKNFLSAIYEIGSTMQADDYIMLSDQDDIWNNDKIYETYMAMKKLEASNSEDCPFLVCTDVTVVDEKMKVIHDSFRKMNNYRIDKLDFSHIIMENKVQGCTAMVNKCLSEMLFEMPENATMHDGWLAIIASAFGKIYYIDKQTMKYRQHSSNVQGSVEYKDDIKQKMSRLDEQRQIVFNTTPQISEFIDIYKDRIPDSIVKAAKAFSTLPNQSFWQKRYNIVKYNMWKSGLLRNIGLMILI